MSCEWFITTDCPRTLAIRIDATAGDLDVDVNFNGRGLVGTSACTGTDSYVTVQRASGDIVDFGIDVWQAYRDSIWTSSTTIEIYTYSTFPAVGDNITTAPAGGAKVSAFGGVFACPYALWATITVLDDGTVSVV